MLRTTARPNGPIARTLYPVLLASLLALLALAALPGAALADDDEDEEEQDFSREGPYLGLSGMFAVDLSTDNLDVSETGGVEARVGFRLAPALALELTGDWLSLGGRNPWSIGIATRLYVAPLLDTQWMDDRLQPFAFGTWGVLSGDLGKGKEPSGHLKLGLGTDYWLTNDVALQLAAGYTLNAGDAARWRSLELSLGVNWRY
ncbi:MAG: hypothetical protein R3E88_07105 [Myxococcota bacterium]